MFSFYVYFTVGLDCNDFHLKVRKTALNNKLKFKVTAFVQSILSLGLINSSLLS